MDVDDATLDDATLEEASTMMTTAKTQREASCARSSLDTITRDARADERFGCSEAAAEDAGTGDAVR